MFWFIQATISRKETQPGHDMPSWSNTQQVPAFYLNGDIQGIVNEEHAAEIASGMLNPFKDENLHVSISVVKADPQPATGVDPLQVKLQSEETMTITLPDGQEVNIMLSDIEDDALPELHIWFEQDLVANCFEDDCGVPAKPLGSDTPNALLMRQIYIPIEPKPA